MFYFYIWTDILSRVGLSGMLPGRWSLSNLFAPKKEHHQRNLYLVVLVQLKLSQGALQKPRA